MRSLQRTMEFLRCLIAGGNAWDFSVVWRLGDDPSRFIEWVDCCCGGGYSNIVVKEESEGDRLGLLCRDSHSQHSITTKACEALSCFPLSMPLYSGIHGEVVITNRPKWLSYVDGSYSNPLYEDLVGTRVLIPVVGGLVELFVAKQMPRDQNLVEFIMAHYNLSLEQEALPINSYNIYSLTSKDIFNLPTEEYTRKWPPPHSTRRKIPPHFAPPGSGSLPPYLTLNKQSGRSEGFKRPKYDESLLKQKKGADSDSDNHVLKKDDVMLKPNSKQFQSKNLILERNRRRRIKEGLYALRAIVPKISKMDRVSILADAIEYIGEIKEREKELQDELNKMEEDDCKINGKQMGKELEGENRGTGQSPATQRTVSFCTLGENKQIKVQVEVNRLGARDLLLKYICHQKRGWFASLMETLHAFGLHVVDANVTTFAGVALNVLKIKANKEVQLKKLKISLLKLAS